MSAALALEGRGGRDGPLAGLDPRLRVLAAAASAVTAVSLHSLDVLAAAFAAALGLAALARLHPGATLRRMAAMDLFMVPLLLFLPFTVPGLPIAELGPWTVSREGVLRAVEIVLTANTVVLVLMSLLGTMPPVVLGHALARLRVPDKLVHLFLFTVRYITTLEQEYARLRLAMRARGFRARGNAHTWRSFGWLFGMLFVRSFERAERITDAMRCRGFAGRYYSLDAIGWRRADSVAAAALAAVPAVLLAAEALR